MEIWITVMISIVTTIIGGVLGYLLSRLSKHADRKIDKKEKLDEKLQELMSENAELRRTINAINEKRKRKEAYHLSNNSSYYILNGTSELFCSLCLDADGNEIHLHVDKDTETFLCPKCKTRGVTDSWRPAVGVESEGISWVNWNG